MRVYFIRHGESGDNVSTTRSGASANLTEDGRLQSRFVAERFEKIPIDLILTSTMPRAQETASIIGRQINRDIECSGLLAEARIPSELLYERHSAQEKKRIFSEWSALRFTDEHARHSDEENLADLKARALNSLQFIASRGVGACLVVTHEVFLRVILGVVLARDTFSPHLFKCLRNSFFLHNTGISVFEYVDPADGAVTQHRYKPGCGFGWRLLTWNDHAHLDKE